MVELVVTLDLRSSVERRLGSSPSRGTKKNSKQLSNGERSCCRLLNIICW